MSQAIEAAFEKECFPANQPSPSGDLISPARGNSCGDIAPHRADLSVDGVA